MGESYFTNAKKTRKKLDRQILGQVLLNYKVCPAMIVINGVKWGPYKLDQNKWVALGLFHPDKWIDL